MADQVPIISDEDTDSDTTYRFEDHPEQKQYITINEVYDHLGFSKKTVLLVVGSSSGLFLFSLTLEWMALVLHYFGCKKHIEDAAVVGIVTGYICGMVISLFVGSIVADRVGRAKVAVFGLYITVIFWLLSIISYIMYAVSSVMVGVGVGCILHSSVTFGFEYTSKSQHSRVMAIQFGMYLVGIVYTLVMFYFLIDVISWKILAILIILPIIPAFPFFHIVADTPKFYAISGRQDQAYLTLFNLHHKQGKPMLKGKLKSCEIKNRGGCCDPYSSGFLLVSCLLSCIYFLVFLGYYSFNYGLVTVLSYSGYCGNVKPSAECQDNNVAIFYKGLFSVTADVLGLAAAVFLSEVTSYRSTMLTLTAISGTSALTALYCINYIAVTIELGVARGCIFGVLCVVVIYTLETYTTNMRCTALGQFLASALWGMWVAAFISTTLEDNIKSLIIAVSVLILLNIIPMYFLENTSNKDDIDNTIEEQSDLTPH